MKLNVRNLDMRYFRRRGMSDQQRKALMIAGVAIGIAAVLTYPAMLLYRRIRDRRNQTGQQEEGNQDKVFAPNYRGNHKPHHRNAEANGQVQQAHA